MKEIRDQKFRVFVLIPVLNEEKSIGKVLEDIPKSKVVEIVVINNGSTDCTAAVAEAQGATVLNEKKRGYGHALIKGIQYISDKNPDILTFMDGDYSDDPKELTRVIRPILDGDADMVIGSRVLGQSEPGALLPQARFGNWIATTLVKLIWQTKFTDLGPFRAIKYDCFTQLNMKELTYGWTVEMQIKAVKNKYKCVEVPVSYRKRIGKSKVTGTISGSAKAGLGILKTIISNCFVK